MAGTSSQAAEKDAADFDVDEQIPDDCYLAEAVEYDEAAAEAAEAAEAQELESVGASAVAPEVDNELDDYEALAALLQDSVEVQEEAAQNAGTVADSQTAASEQTVLSSALLSATASLVSAPQPLLAPPPSGTLSVLAPQPFTSQPMLVAPLSTSQPFMALPLVASESAATSSTQRPELARPLVASQSVLGSLQCASQPELPAAASSTAPVGATQGLHCESEHAEGAESSTPGRSDAAALAEQAMEAMLCGDMEKYNMLNAQLTERQAADARLLEKPSPYTPASASGDSGTTVGDHTVRVLDPVGRLIQESARYATFTEAPFPPSIMADLLNAGFPAPSQIQQFTWPLAVAMHDVVGIAATGSGKTLAFLLPAFAYMLQRRPPGRGPVLLVIAPTRELAMQIDDEAKKFGRSSGIRTACCYGGAPKNSQLADIRAGIHCLAGTPGRINDFLESRQLDLQGVAKLVLDEADRMLDMGFEPQIRRILAHVPAQRQTLFFTATWPPAVRHLAGEFLRDAYQVQIGNRDELAGNRDITQVVKLCSVTSKSRVLVEVLQEAGVTDLAKPAAKALVFCSTKRLCDQLAQHLARMGVPCSCIHGDKDQRQREQALSDLKQSHIRLLVATDVAARGLDIKGITLVVNYDAPSATEDYVHRIGRTGRAGQKGQAVTLVSERDVHALRGIIAVMRRTNQQVPAEVERTAWSRGPASGSRGSCEGDGSGLGSLASSGRGRIPDRSRSRGFASSALPGAAVLEPLPPGTPVLEAPTSAVLETTALQRTAAVQAPVATTSRHVEICD